MKICFVFICSVLLTTYVRCDGDFVEETTVDRTEVQPNGLRFQRILQRKRRFLLFPPGAAILVSSVKRYRICYEFIPSSYDFSYGIILDSFEISAFRPIDHAIVCEVIGAHFTVRYQCTGRNRCVLSAANKNRRLVSTA